MTSPVIPTGFLDAVGEHPCGIVAHFDLADAKRRNTYLGFAEVDRDIEELTSMLAAYGPPIEFSSRIGGNQWAVFLSGSDSRPLVEILTQFKRQQPATVGWTAIARKRFRRSKSMTSIRNSSLYRCLRCVYSTINAAEELALKWQIIYDKTPYARVDQPSDISDDGQFISDFEAEPRWRCIIDDVAPFSCPYCAGTDFDWYDGDTTVFGACGHCRDCRADVEFRNSFKLAPEAELPSNLPVAGPGKEKVAIRIFPYKTISPEEYAAKVSHRWGCFSFSRYQFEDIKLHEWIQRLGDILFRREGVPTVKELREQLLSKSEIEKIQKEIEDQDEYGF